MASLGGSSRRQRTGQDFKYLSVGGGDLIYKVRKVTASVNPASLAAVTKSGTAVTVSGVVAGDLVVAIPPATLEDDLIPAGAVATATDEVTLYLYNASAGAVDGAALTWTFLILRMG